MEVTLEQVERLREKADVSYAKAKEALEAAGVAVGRTPSLTAQLARDAIARQRGSLG